MSSVSIKQAVLCLLGAAAVTTSASAATIYNDTFTDNTGGLNNRPVETGSGSWIAATNNATVGGGFATTGANRNSFLSFNPISGNIYTLDVVASAANTGDVWGAIGFSGTPGVNSNGDGGSNWLGANPSTSAWWLFRPIASVAPGQTFAIKGPGTSGGLTAGPNVSAGTHDYQIVLNASNSTNSLWTVAYSVDGTLVRGPEAFGFAPNIQYVGFGSNGAIDSVDSFTLLNGSASPEPAALATVAIGSIGLLRRRRR